PGRATPVRREYAGVGVPPASVPPTPTRQSLPGPIARPLATAGVTGTRQRAAAPGWAARPAAGPAPERRPDPTVHRPPLHYWPARPVAAPYAPGCLPSDLPGQGAAAGRPGCVAPTTTSTGWPNPGPGLPGDCPATAGTKPVPVPARCHHPPRTPTGPAAGQGKSAAQS